MPPRFGALRNLNALIELRTCLTASSGFKPVMSTTTSQSVSKIFKILDLYLASFSNLYSDQSYLLSPVLSLP